MKQVNRFNRETDKGQTMIGKIIGITVAILVVGVMFPPAFRTLAGYSSDVEIVVENSEFVKEEAGGENYFLTTVETGIENLEENNTFYRVYAEPKSCVDNYRALSTALGDEYNQICAIQENTGLTGDYFFENKVEWSGENYENIGVGFRLNSIVVDGSAHSIENFDYYFDSAKAQLVLKNNGGSGLSPTMRVLLIVLFPILSMVAVIRVIFGNV